MAKLRNKSSSNARLTTQKPELNGIRMVYQFQNQIPTSLLKMMKVSKPLPSEKLGLKTLVNTLVKLKSLPRKAKVKLPVMLRSEV